MTRNGYTVVEVLAATLILGLAFGGLLAGLRAFQGLQRRSAEHIASGRTSETAAAAVTRLLAQPSASSVAMEDTLAGDTRTVQVCCATPPCTLSVDAGGIIVLRLGNTLVRRRLAGVQQPALRYLTTEGVLDRWPPAPPVRARLRGVAIVDTGSASASPIAAARLWSQQPQDCQFDSISAKCRPPLP